MKQNRQTIMDDLFIREHIEDLLRTIRRQVLQRIVRPYKRISLAAIARELNDIPVEDVESLLVSLILDGSMNGKIDRVDKVLLKQAEKGAPPSSSSGTEPQKQTTTMETEEECAVVENMISQLQTLSTQVTSMRLKDNSMMGIVHG